jgi:hypothetical protein
MTNGAFGRSAAALVLANRGSAFSSSIEKGVRHPCRFIRSFSPWPPPETCIDAMAAAHRTVP